MKFFEKIAAYGFPILGVLVLLPLVLISPFNYPSVDDICYVQRSMEHDFWPLQWIRYMEWSGRYLSSFLLSAYFTLAKNYEGYWLLPLIFLGLFMHSLWHLIRELFPSAHRLEQLSIALGVAILYLYGMPSIVEGVFWVTGSMTYFLPVSLVFYGFAILLRNKFSRNWYLVALLILTVLIAGGNETVLVIWVTGLFSGLAWLIYRKQFISKSFLLLLFVTLIVGIISVLAPGNGARGAGFSNNARLFFSIKETVLTSLWYVKRWLIETPVVLSFLLFLPIGMRWAQQNTQSKGNENFTRPAVFDVPPFLLILLVGALYLFTFFMPYYTTGGPPPLRTLNISYLLFMLGGLICIQSLLYYSFQQFKIKPYRIPSLVKFGLGLILLLFFLKPNNIRTAYIDIFSGEAKAYQKEIDARLLALPSCPVDTCELSRFVHRPTTIYFDDITSDAADWRNRCYAPVYGKKAVRWKE